MRLENKMINVITGNARMSLVSLAAAVVLTTGFSGEAAAKHRGHLARHRLENTFLAASIHETTRPASMRYYGGPKSPMWSSQ
jgi:hypothetical protein